jgi:hypothetical protein
VVKNEAEMDNEIFPDYLRQAIADGEVSIDEEAQTARVYIAVMNPPKT